MSAEPSSAGPLVLLIDDDLAIRRLLATSLEARGLRMLVAATGAEGIKLAADYAPDLVLLDLGLPDQDGVMVCQALRAWFAGPILVLSARDQEAEKVMALDAGADDYLTKPFGVLELHARIRASLRRSAAPAGDVPTHRFVSGLLTVDLEARRVWRQDEEVHLTPVEYKLLTTLIRHVGRVVTHRQLLQEVWGPRSVSRSHYLRVYMTYLRRKLEPDPLQPRLFRTETGIGYRMLLPEET